MRQLALVTLLLCACQPSSQVLLYVDTDAPLPPDPTSSTDAPPFLFDHLRIDVADQTRSFPVHAGMFAARTVSIGIAPPVNVDDFTARVRLYRGDHAPGSEPQSSASLDTTVRLPPLAETGTTEITVTLHVEDVGRALGPVDPDPGPPAESLVGSWPGATRVDCPQPARAGEVCVPGGAYWMGDPRLTGQGADRDADRERLVVVSPFYLDAHELTVGEFRQHGGSPSAVLAWNGTSDPSRISTYCTYGQSDELPLNCISWTAARSYCRARGKDLPTEAQFEWIASGLGAERSFPWGNDDPQCADAVWGRGGLGAFADTSPSCLPEGSIGGALPPGSALRDVLDLGGNLAEWARDLFTRQDEAYWSRAGVFTNPLADLNGDEGGERSARGGNWDAPSYYLLAAFRRGGPPNAVAPELGFRCVRSP